jgi:hypothetical protein
MQEVSQMRCFAMYLTMILGLLAGSATAGELREVQLSDGSVVSGEVLSLSGGIYTIKSETLGTLRLEESKVRVIRPKSSPKSNAGGDTKSLQEKMMSDQEVMSMITSLQNDPEFKKIMEDPKLVQAVAAGDIAVLMADPRFVKLLSNPAVQEIQKKVK